MKVRLNRRQRLLVSTVVLLVTSIAVMTLAFFNSTDTVSNRISSRDAPKILLNEPKWYSQGIELAQRYVPDVTIPKDPYVTNLSDYDVYVRMKLEVLDASGEVITDNPDRVDAILSTIYLGEDKNSTTLFTFGTDGKVTNNNPDFYYDSGYFYYGTKNAKSGIVELTPLKPKRYTSTLFESIVTPSTELEVVDDNGNTAFKYDLYYSEAFSIRVSAESIYVIEGSDESFKSIVKRFNKS